MKRYIIGDIHGCYRELSNLLQMIENHAGGEQYKIIFVGDYVDRGPNVRECIEKVKHMQSLGHVALMGNHEDMLLANELTYARSTLQSYDHNIPEDVLEWMRGLPKYYEDDTIIAVHAGAKPGIPMSEQSDAMLMWYRYTPGQLGDMGKHLYHGHTPKEYVERKIDRTCVDTACVYFGMLTAAVVGQDGNPVEFIHVKNHR